MKVFGNRGFARSICLSLTLLLVVSFGVPAKTFTHGKKTCDTVNRLTDSLDMYSKLSNGTQLDRVWLPDARQSLEQNLSSFIELILIARRSFRFEATVTLMDQCRKKNRIHLLRERGINRETIERRRQLIEQMTAIVFESASAHMTGLPQFRDGQQIDLISLALVTDWMTLSFMEPLIDYFSGSESVHRLADETQSRLLAKLILKNLDTDIMAPDESQE